MTQTCITRCVDDDDQNLVVIRTGSRDKGHCYLVSATSYSHARDIAECIEKALNAVFQLACHMACTGILLDGK